MLFFAARYGYSRRGGSFVIDPVDQGAPVTKDELSRIEKFLRKTLQSPGLTVRARPKKEDSAEVYVGDEFIGVLFRDDEDPDDISYNFQMAILDYDLVDT